MCELKSVFVKVAAVQ